MKNNVCVGAVQSVVICYRSLSRLIQYPKMKSKRDCNKSQLGKLISEEGLVIRKKHILEGCTGYCQNSIPGSV